MVDNKKNISSFVQHHKQSKLEKSLFSGLCLLFFFCPVSTFNLQMSGFEINRRVSIWKQKCEPKDFSCGEINRW